MMRAILEFNRVCYWYTHQNQRKMILRQANIEFHEGKFYTIIGPSGAGKTTFLSLVSALEKPKEGQILFKGRDINEIGLTTFRNKHVSIVFQSYNLLPYMTGLQNVLTAMEITKTKVDDPKAHALEILAKVGISETEAMQKVPTLSGGQQQRVAIARALCCQADIIAADEPTGNLDEETAEEIVKLFKDLAYKEKKCIVMVTHNPDIAKQSDTVIKLTKGSLTIFKSIKENRGCEQNEKN